ncbi:HAMP domain-containing protein [Anaerolineae bacterium CFX7]|nr:HAMP domain-containing protein [Anaerolineae bacterium CFX7]
MNSIQKKISPGARLRALWHPLGRRLALTYFLLALVSVGGLIVWSGVQLEQATWAQQAHNLEIQAQLVANALGSGFDESKEHKRNALALQQLVNTYAADHLNDGDAPTRITVVDEKLRVLASSDARVQAGREDNHPEFVAARAGFEQPDIRRDEFANEERIFVAAPIRGQDDDLAFAQLSMSTRPIQSVLRQMWLGLLGAGALILVLTTVVSWWLARGIARPVQTLTNASEAIARGALARRVTPQGPDEIERLGRAFNRMTDQLQELIVREQEFAANAAHELRSPLTSLRLRLELLQDAARADPQMAARYVVQMERELVNLQRMVDQLLALATLEQSGCAARAALDLAPLLYELADEISPLVQAAQVQWRVDVPIHLPPVYANAEQLRMAVRNLLDNALKYTPANGLVTLHATTQTDCVVIEVSDTGSGIPSDALPHIFERFYRTADTRANRVRGSGLGLALTRSLVEANGGEICARSKLEEGSTFTLRLPQSAQDDSP